VSSVQPANSRGALLARVLNQLLRHPSWRCGRGGFARRSRPDSERELARLARAPLTLRDAERELEQVHRSELAWLLREAAHVRLEASASCENPAPLDLATLRAGLREEWESARADGYPATRVLDELVATCLQRDVAAWPSSAELARVSLRLQEDPHARLRLALGLLAEGRARDAAREFLRVLDRDPPPSLVPELTSGLERAVARIPES
jgi:hypothetical protein